MDREIEIREISAYPVPRDTDDADAAAAGGGGSGVNLLQQMLLSACSDSLVQSALALYTVCLPLPEDEEGGGRGEICSLVTGCITFCIHVLLYSSTPLSPWTVGENCAAHSAFNRFFWLLVLQ